MGKEVGPLVGWLENDALLLVSACLLGMCTAYDGGSSLHPRLQALATQGRTVPLCPEVAGGLPVPRPPAEIQGGEGADVLDGRACVVTADGQDVTAQYLAGAQAALAAARRFGLCRAILKSRSPSCGAGQIYDGTFSRRLRPGDGVTAALLKREGIAVHTEEEEGENDTMSKQIVECVPNFSEGRRQKAIDAIAAVIGRVSGVKVLDVKPDADHNRTVVTFIGQPQAVEEAAFQGVAEAAELIDMDVHQGEHPRVGAADVVPFVPIQGVSLDDCVAMAARLGARVGSELEIPVYLYEAAATNPARRNLADVRRGEYEGLKHEIAFNPAREPDFGPKRMGKAGATIIGARPPLIAFNVTLAATDVSVAKKIARAVRHSSGGLRYVKALGLSVEGQAQVSLNLTDYRRTPIHRVMEMIRREAARYGVGVASSEIIGLVPQRALLDAALYYLQLDGFAPDQVLESRLVEG